METLIWLIVFIMVVAVIVRALAASRPRRPRLTRLDRIESDPETLALHGLPVLTTDADLADALGIDGRTLRWLADRRAPDPSGASRHYILKRIPKGQGGERILLAPKRRLKDAQRWILREILQRVPPHEAAHGFRRGRSIASHAMPHAGKAVVVNLDLRDFFHTITYPRVRGLFYALGYGREVSATLALLCTTRLPGSRKRILPQGAPTSPAISNLIARKLDKRLAGLAAALGYAYSRYADDCTLSGNAPSQLGALIRVVRMIVRGERFKLHENKWRIIRKGACQRVTGLVVNTAPTISRQERRRLRAILHQAQFTGLDAQNRQRHPRFLDYLQGKLAFLHMVNPHHAAPLRDALARLTGQPEKTPQPVTAQATQPAPLTESTPEAEGVEYYTAGPEKLEW